MNKSPPYTKEAKFIEHFLCSFFEKKTGGWSQRVSTFGGLCCVWVSHNLQPPFLASGHPHHCHPLKDSVTLPPGGGRRPHAGVRTVPLRPVPPAGHRHPGTVGVDGVGRRQVVFVGQPAAPPSGVVRGSARKGGHMHPTSNACTPRPILFGKELFSNFFDFFGCKILTPEFVISLLNTH